MMEKPTVEEAEAHLETWMIAPSSDYRETLSWLAVLSGDNLEYHLDYVASMAAIDKEYLRKEVNQRRKLLNGELNTQQPSSPGGGWANQQRAQMGQWSQPQQSPPGTRPFPQQQPQPQPHHQRGWAQPQQQQQFGPQHIQAPTHVPPAIYSGQVQCRHCGHVGIPVKKTSVSAAGWILAAILFFTTGCLAILPLLFMQETRHTCANCGHRV